MEDVGRVQALGGRVASHDPADGVGVLLAFLVLFLSIVRDPLEACIIKGSHILVLLFLVVVLIQGLVGTRLTVWKRQQRLLIYAGSLAVCLATLTLVGIARGTTSWGMADADLRDYLSGVLYLVGLCVCRGAIKSRARLWDMFLVTGTAVTWLAYLWTTWKSPEVLAGFFNNPLPDGRMVGGFLGPNECGAFIAILLTAILANGLFAHRARSAIPGILMSALLWIPLAATGSRGAIGGAAVGVASCYVLWLLHSRQGGKKLLVTGLLGTLLISGLLTAPGLGPFELVAKRFSRAPLSDLRVEFIAAGLRMAADSPVLGFGVGGFAQNASLYLETSTTTPPHNEFINMLVSGGPTALALLILVLVSALRASFRRAIAHPKEWAIAAAMLVFISQEFFFNYLTRPKLGFVFWFLCWLSVAPLLKGSLSQDDAVAGGFEALSLPDRPSGGFLRPSRMSDPGRCAPTSRAIPSAK